MWLGAAPSRALERSECNRTLKLDLGLGVSNEDRESAQIRAPIVRARIVIRERASIEHERDALRRSRTQADSREAFQFLVRARYGRLRLADIDFRDFRAFATTGVCHIERYFVGETGIRGHWAN